MTLFYIFIVAVEIEIYIYIYRPIACFSGENMDGFVRDLKTVMG